MNATIERMRRTNEQESRETDALLKNTQEWKSAKRQAEYPLNRFQAGNGLTPRAILAWFFTWTLCAVGFVLVMTVAATAAKALKMLVP